METFISGQSLILEKIAAGAALSDVLERLVSLVELHSTEMLCSILLVDDDGLHLRLGAAPSLPESYVEAIDGIAIGPTARSCGTAAHRATTVIVTDIETDPLWDDYRELGAEHGFRACWSSPILSHTGRLLGTFAIYYRTPRGPLPEEQRLSEIAIYIAAIAIENRRTEESLRKSEERFRLVALAIRDGIYDCDLRTHTVWRNETYQRLFSAGEPIGVTSEWWEGRLHPRDRERIMASFDHACQTHSQFWSGDYSFRKPDGTYATVIDRGYILFDDAGQAVRVIGVVADITERRLAEEALQKREDELNRSNAQIRELAQKLMTAQEEERRRISRQLHDDLNQKVAALSIAFSSIKQQLPPNSNGLNSRLDMVHTLCVEIAEGIRRLSHELHPAVLEHIGLAAALKVYLAEVSILEGVQISLTLRDAVAAIPQDAAVCLYRVAQESLRNVVKHSGVKSAEVALSVDHQGVHLQVSDYGLGFDLALARNNGGVGLASMEERVRLMQGSFTIASEPGRGSKLMASIPLRK